MAYEVLARKWRPQNFKELIGQVSVHKTLTNALNQNRLYPVLLFTGPRGTGKTSTARILAKTLRCLEKKEQRPCGVCEECLLIQDGKSLDVIEIDGASNNGVDAVRELRDAVNYMPSKGVHKIYIIDEVHMLSNSAFNALLKTLEEPPEHVIFIMATTEAHKIPQTVTSRCQKLDFHLIPPLLIKNQLEKICKDEKIHLDDPALWLIAKQAQGSLRDAESLLDQMITFCGDQINTEQIIEILGLTDSEIILKSLQSIVERNEKQMLEVLKDIHSKGNEPKLILQSLIEGLRNLLILKINPKNKPPLVQASDQEIEHLNHIASQSSYEDLHFLFDMLLKGEREFHFSSDSHMVLEVLLLRFCQSPKLETLIPLSLTEQSTSHSQSPQVPTKEAKKKLELSPTKKKIESQNKSTFSQFEFIDFLKKEDSSQASLFENLSFKEKKDQTYIYFIPKSFSYLQKRLSDKKTHQSLEEKLTFFLNSSKKLSIQFEISKESLTTLKHSKTQRDKAELLKEAKSDSFTKQVAEVFEGTIASASKEPPDAH